MSDRDSRLDSTSLERIVPDELRAGEATGEETLRLHMERYQFAKQHLIRGSLLDIARGAIDCFGSGYAFSRRKPPSQNKLLGQKFSRDGQCALAEVCEFAHSAAAL